MKLVKTGKISFKDGPWWVGLKITCQHCKSVMELEALDNVDRISVVQERRLNGKSTITFTCMWTECMQEVVYEHDWNAKKPKNVVELPKE